MTDLRKAAEMALEALECMKGYGDVFLSRSHEQKPYDQVCATIEALRQALAQTDEVLAEREACAKVCEKERDDLLWREGQTLPQGEPRLIHMAGIAGRCADIIRARGNHD